MPEDTFGKTTCRALIALCSDHLELGHQLLAERERYRKPKGETPDDGPDSKKTVDHTNNNQFLNCNFYMISIK